MTFPTTPIPTTNLDSSADDPSLARADILQMAQTLNTIMDEANQANGVALLTSEGTYDGTKLPNSLYSAGQMTLTPGNNILSLQGIIRLQRAPKSVILAWTDMIDGDMVLATDADGGNLALCIYVDSVSAWKYMPIASWTTLA